MTVPESSEGTTNYELIETLWNVNTSPAEQIKLLATN